ncbi:hypothetical protein [uncultured Metabacillus sp.]|nr:hypothetical protein [uncultured Metabacillus sp.]
MEVYEQKVCENCGKETKHEITEDIMSIYYHCLNCDHTYEMVKNFF